jgi:hypothetical protein
MATVTLDALADYVAVLAASAHLNTRKDDRQLYEMHLARAALMFVAAHGHDGHELLRLIEEERRGYGWSFLPGDEGDRAETAFNTFADAMTRGLRSA